MRDGGRLDDVANRATLVREALTPRPTRENGKSENGDMRERRCAEQRCTTLRHATLRFAAIAGMASASRTEPAGRRDVRGIRIGRRALCRGKRRSACLATARLTVRSGE
ncbi:hypothetical protein DR62_06405 [Burkholderia thailandensis]|nr:hypothetical protein DR62_06405 [Burkholderia thailandensis]